MREHSKNQNSQGNQLCLNAREFYAPMPDGPPVPHSDSISPRFMRGNGNYTSSTTYSEHPEKTEYGSVTARFDEDLELFHPAPDIETLLQTTHLTAQLHEFNRDQQAPDWPFPNDGTTLYDVAILSVLDDVLSIEDLSPNALAIPTQRFKTIFLKEARNASTLKGFYGDIKNSELVLAELGYQDASELVGYERFRQEVRDNLPDELDGIDTLEDGREAFNAAVIRAVYAVRFSVAHC